MQIDNISLLAIIFLTTAFCQLLAWRVRLPPILFLLLAGIMAGPVLKIVQPEQLLGELFSPFVSFSVAIILFEGSLSLKFQEIRGLHVVVRNLVSSGMLATWAIITLATWMIFDVSPEVATLFGAIMVVTGPTVVSPILRTVKPNLAIQNILKWESIIIDPIGASLAVLVFEFIIIGGGQQALGHTLFVFIQLLICGGLTGVVTGYGFGLALRYYLIPEFLQNITALGILFISYALADSLQPESGLVSVTVFGLILANMRDVELKHILAFKETLSILLISLLFIILAARINLAELLAPGWKALLVYLVIQLVARPICIFSSTMGSTLSRPEKIFLSWIAPRGIVAAAISSLFALKLQDYGHTDAAVLVPLTFTIIILTVVIQSISALPLAKYLRIIRPPSNGVFIAGSNPVSRIIAKKLIDLGVQTMITDNSSDRRREAEKQQLPVYSGENQKNAVGSIFDIFGFKQMLAFSASENHNLAATLYYRRDFDKKHIYSILASPGKKRNMHFHRMGSPQLHSKILFGEEVSYQLLREFFESGATLQLFSPEGKYDPQLFRHRCGSKAIPLFAFDPQNRVHCFAADTTLPIDEGWKILYLG